jgi:Polysaccharide pyruvyl transferase
MTSGILTFHAGFNHGAFLQAYALQKALFRQHIDNLIINYQGFKQCASEYRQALIKRDISFFPERCSRVLKFKKAQRRLKKTPRYFRSGAVHAEFDQVVFGSDEIWNLHNTVFGRDYTYFGESMTAVKISYAASFGSTHHSVALPERVKHNLSRFRQISVRDQNSCEIIKNSLGFEPAIVPDPTIVYDVFQDAQNCKFENFILIYALDLNGGLVRRIQELARAKSKQIISVGYKNAWAHKNIINLSPFDLLGFYRSADFVFTDLFHGTIFSILAKKQFILQLSHYRCNKFYPMLNYLGLENRLYREDKADELLADAIDYRDVDLRLEKYRGIGIDFLQQHVKSGIKTSEIPLHENRL